MPSMQLNLNQSAIGKLALQSDEVRALVTRVTEQAHARVAGAASDQVTSQVGGKARARGVVRRADVSAEGRDGILSRELRNLRVGGGD